MEINDPKIGAYSFGNFISSQDNYQIKFDIYDKL